MTPQIPSHAITIEASQFVYFARVAKHRSFSAAAKELGVSKSTLSRAVVNLERRLGALLLTRTRRRVDITPDGERLYAHCQAVYKAVLGARQVLEDIEAECSVTPKGQQETSAANA